MAARGNRGTYDLGAYRNQRNASTSANRQVVRGTAVPKTRPNPAPQQLRAEARRSRAVAIRVVALAAVLFLVFGFKIYSQVQVDELDQKLDAINKEISVIESDNTRRNMELNANVSLEKVDQYARNELGMVKISDYQVNYVKLSEDDAVEVSGGKTHNDKGIAQKLKINKNE